MQAARLFGVFGVLVVLLINGCSSNKSVVPPSPLPQFKAEIAIENLWSTRVGSGVDERYLSLKPAVTERWVLAASVDGVVIKVDRETGKRQWSIDLEREISGGLASAYGVVALGTANGELVMLNVETGEILWEKPLSGQVLSQPALTASHVVVQTLDGRLHGLDRRDGSSVWLFDTSTPILTLRGESSPVVKDNAALAGFANGKLVALEVKTGEVAWENPVGEPSGRSELERLIDLDGRFSVSGNRVYAVTYQGKVAAIDIPTGRVLWSRPLSSYAGLTYHLGRLYVVTEDSLIQAMDAISGTDLWQQERLQGRQLSTPSAYERYVLVGDYEGFLYWLSNTDGQLLARAKVGSKSYQLANDKAASLRHVTDPSDGLRVEPVIMGNTVYVQSNRGDLVAYRVIETK